jgi:hypothetical protein
MWSYVTLLAKRALSASPYDWRRCAPHRNLPRPSSVENGTWERGRAGTGGHSPRRQHHLDALTNLVRGEQSIGYQVLHNQVA